jgi:hypothetical protein
MSLCPGCNQPIDTKTISCPNCEYRSRDLNPPSSNNQLLTGFSWLDGLFAFVLYGGILVVLLRLGSDLRSLLLLMVAAPLVLLIILGMFRYRALALGLLFGVGCLLSGIGLLFALMPR